MRKRFLIFSILFAGMEVGIVDRDVFPGSSKTAMHVSLGLIWKALRRTSARRYLRRNRGAVPNSAAWFNTACHYSSEQRCRSYFCFSWSTFLAVNALFEERLHAGFYRGRCAPHLRLDVQPGITLYRLGHYGNGFSVDAGANLMGVFVGAVVKSTWRVVKVVATLAPLKSSGLKL